MEFIIEERGGKREQDACDASAPIDFVLTPDEEVPRPLHVLRRAVRRLTLRARHARRAARWATTRCG